MIPNDNYIKTVSKALSIQVAPIKNSDERRNAIVNQLKYVILFIAGLGVNRTYLLKYRRVQQWSFYVYCISVNIMTVYALTSLDPTSASYIVIRQSSCIEYVLLVLIAMISKKSSMQNLFDDLSSFDDLFNIKEDLNVIVPTTRFLVWVLLIFLYSFVEYILLLIYVMNSNFSETILAALSHTALMTHDAEQLFVCSLLRTILMRVRILKAHVTKVLADGKEAKKKLDKVEALSNKTQLDIHSLHRNYELLHKCAEQLNSIMSLPMMIMLLYSGLTTIMLLKSSFKVLQTAEDITHSTVILYNLVRCVKYTVLVVIPCYYSSVTTSQVAQIRTMLHDAMNSVQIDKLERRRLKAFFQLTRECEFAYALWGVIRLNMSLPLSYLSLCTTYLVIVIQFSKFID